MLIKMTTVKNIYDFINKIAPYNTQESFDNSGFMVGDFKKKVEKAIVCLDVTEKILYFAKKNKVDLIISHHPVIFSELKQIRSDSIVYKLINNNISCLSAHTNFDKCDGGIDDVFANSLSLENIENLKNGIGKIGNISEKLTPLDFAKFVKQRLKIEKIKIVCSNKPVKKIATICGSGGSYIQDALFAGADTIVTGDLKQE
ncbi:MAG: Nif3-like dinuclear metal center hexameric protein, partial [Oscillospiraceae bacterium]